MYLVKIYVCVLYCIIICDLVLKIMYNFEKETNRCPAIHDCSVRNRSGIIAQHGVSNAKPSMVDLILRLPETNFR